MIKIENTIVPSSDQWKSIIFGARNPLNSWDRSDTDFIPGFLMDDGTYIKGGPEFGPNDKDLMKRLRNAGTDHRKFMRMITVYVDITAPLYFWKEFSTYKVGTVANSCSTMHKIHAKEFTLDDFSHYNLEPEMLAVLGVVIFALNAARDLYISSKGKTDWWQMIQLLPSSYNQKRTVMLNYEVLANMYKSRKNHKLDEWRELCEWMRGLPYSELITGEFDA